MSNMLSGNTSQCLQRLFHSMINNKWQKQHSLTNVKIKTQFYLSKKPKINHLTQFIEKGDLQSISSERRKKNQTSRLVH